MDVRGIVLILGFCQACLGQTPLNSISSTVPVSIECSQDASGLRCSPSFKEVCRERWDFSNPCTQANMEANRTRFVHPYDNTKFLMCDDNGKLFVVQCPRYEIYHEGCEQCVGDNDQLTNTCETPLTELVRNPCSEENILANKLFFPFPGDMSRFIHCDIWGKAWERFCPPGDVWNQLETACVDPLSINPCTMLNADLSKLYKHPCDPTKFLQCVGDVAFEITCPANNAFNYREQLCRTKGSFAGSADANMCSDRRFSFKIYGVTTTGGRIQIYVPEVSGASVSTRASQTGASVQTGKAGLRNPFSLQFGSRQSSTGSSSQFSGSFTSQGSASTSGSADANLSNLAAEGASAFFDAAASAVQASSGTGSGGSTGSGTIGAGTVQAGGEFQASLETNTADAGAAGAATAGIQGVGQFSSQQSGGGFVGFGQDVASGQTIKRTLPKVFIDTSLADQSGSTSGQTQSMTVEGQSTSSQGDRISQASGVSQGFMSQGAGVSQGSGMIGQVDSGRQTGDLSGQAGMLGQGEIAGHGNMAGQGDMSGQGFDMAGLGFEMTGQGQQFTGQTGEMTSQGEMGVAGVAMTGVGGMTGQEAVITGEGGVITGEGSAMTGQGQLMTSQGQLTTGSGEMGVQSVELTGAGSSVGHGGIMTGDAGTMTGQGQLMTGQGEFMIGQGGVITGQGQLMSGQGEVMTGQGIEGGVMTGAEELIDGPGSLRPSQGGEMTGQGGVMTGQSGVMTGQSGVMTGQSGVISGQSGVTSGQSGVMTGQGGVMTGHGGVKSGQSGVMTGQGGVMTGQGGVMTDQGGVMTGQGGVMTGQSGLISGQSGVMTGQGGVMIGPGGVMTGQSGLISGQSGVMTDQSGVMTGQGETMTGGGGVIRVTGVEMSSQGSGTTGQGQVMSGQGGMTGGRIFITGRGFASDQTGGSMTGQSQTMDTSGQSGGFSVQGTSGLDGAMGGQGQGQGAMHGTFRTFSFQTGTQPGQTGSDASNMLKTLIDRFQQTVSQGTAGQGTSGGVVMTGTGVGSSALRDVVNMMGAATDGTITEVIAAGSGGGGGGGAGTGTMATQNVLSETDYIGYTFSKMRYADPCNRSNIAAGRLYFKLRTDRHKFIQCDTNGYMHVMPCSSAGADFFDPDVSTCVDGPVHVDNIINASPLHQG